MNPLFLTFRAITISVSLLLVISSAGAENTTVTAGELASRLSALRQDGSSYVRMRLEIKGASRETFQLQIKERRSKTSTEVVYQILWPKERKGESVLLRKMGNRPASGSTFVPPNTVRTLESADMKEPLFGSDISYEDVVENFFAWEQQKLIGSEEVDGVNCQILQSKPDKGGSSIYTSVRSWIDTRRMIPLRIEKYSGSGQLLRRIETTKIVADAGKHIPANLTVRDLRRNSSTILDGSRIKHDVTYADREFSAEGLIQVIAPQSGRD